MQQVSGPELKWWQSGVIYQIYPRSFMDSNGDGVGDLRGIKSKLDYLTWLGVDAIWLSPIFPSPMADFGYDISNYTDVEPVFGTLQDFDDLLAEVHRHGLKLLLDLVPNHTSDEHPWFQESQASRDNPKRDWYVWRDPAPNGGPPNNWQSHFGGSAWQFDPATGQYYLHLFDVKQPDLNWRNPAVQQSMYDVMRFWLERGVDGFRIDVLWLLVKDARFRDNPPNPEWQEGHPAWHRYLETYNADQPETHEIVREMRRIADSYPDRVLIGEIYLPYARLMDYYGPNLDEAHLPFNFQLIQLPGWQAASVAQIVEEYEGSLPAGAWPNWVLSNHDRPRMVTRVGMDQARVAQMLLLTLRGTPTCYYGDELGMHDVPIPPEKIYDPRGKFSPEHGRDPVRTPMQWDASPHGGFSTAEPWLPLPNDYSRFNVAVESKDEHSLLSLFRKLLELRRNLPALLQGSYQTIKSDNPQVFSYIRQHEQQKVLVVLNFSAAPQQFRFRGLENKSGEILCSTFLDVSDAAILLQQVSLRPNEGLLILLK
jgi:alpha-glucosidase